MKKRILFLLLVFTFLAPLCFSESYGDIIVYTVDSYQKSSLLRFQESLSSESFVCKESDLFYDGSSLRICLVVKSKGYGVDMYEYKIIGDFDKRIISTSSPYYYDYNRLFR